MRLGGTRLGQADHLVAPPGLFAVCRETVAGFHRRQADPLSREGEVEALCRRCSQSCIFGRVGLGLKLIGFVFIAVDLRLAADRSVRQSWFKPIGAEVVNQGGALGLRKAKAGFGARPRPRRPKAQHRIGTG